MKALLIVCIALSAIAVQSANAVKCYDCSSATESGCGDPFSSSANQCTGVNCAKGKVTINGVALVTRSCTAAAGVESGKSVCKSASYSGATGTSCSCASDLCNKSANTAPSVCLLVFLSVAAALKANTGFSY